VWIGLVFFSGILFPLDPHKKITQYIFDSWTSQYGLPQISVKKIIQTGDRFVWLGTPEGLLRFDGVRFVLFNEKNTPGLKNSYVNDILEDHRERLWISTNNGLSCLSGGKFRTYSMADGLLANTVGPMLVGRNGDIWIGTGNGLNRFHEGKFIAYTTAAGLSANLIAALHEDRSGCLWIGTNRGLTRFQNDRFTTYSLPDGLAHPSVRAIHEDHKSRLWIVTLRGLSRFQNGRFVSFLLPDGFFSTNVKSIYEDGAGDFWLISTTGIVRFRDGVFRTYGEKEKLSFRYALSISGDRDGNIWVGTPNGLNRFEEESFSAFNSRDGLTHDFVNSIFEDHEGSVWLGTPDGLNRLKDGKFTSYTKKDGLNDVMAICVVEDRENSIWISTSAGLNRLRNGSVTSYSTESGLSSVLIRALCVDHTGNLWISTENGLNCFRDGQFSLFTTRHGLSSDNIGAIAEDGHGILWISTDSGLDYMQDGKVFHFSATAGFPAEEITVIQADGPAGLWIGTDGGGIVHLGDKSMKRYTTAEGLSSNRINCFLPEDRDTLWIGTNAGLNLLKNGRFSVFMQKNGLLEDIIHRIMEDDQGNFWMSSPRGVFQVKKRDLMDFASGKISQIPSLSYDKMDGMSNAECVGLGQPAGWKSRDGRLWFPTLNGVTMVDPNRIKLNSQPPALQIEQLLVDQKVTDLFVDEVRIPPGKRTLEFQYTALSYLIPGRVLFKYRLEGYDKQWQAVGTRRTAYYTGIPPGRYRFRVSACNNDGVWNEQGTSLRFYLQPFFYQTTWFYIFSALVVGLMGFGYTRLRVKGLKNREKQLEALVFQRTSQLEEANQKLKQLASIDGLTGIANYRRFEEFFSTEWKRSARNGTAISLIVADVDFFKPYNDRYGHQAGDQCLKMIADILNREAKRPGDLAARYGGEEFVIVLAETAAEGALHLSEKVRKAVETLRIAHETSTVENYITISLGCASVVPSDQNDPSSLLYAADMALYTSKSKGRNRCTVANGADQTLK